MAHFVGQSEADLVRQLGVPSRSYDVDGQRFLAYTERRLDVTPGFYPGPWWGPWGPWGYPLVPQQVVEYGCETTFDIAAGKVQSFTIRGNDC
jgi:hypothetical protein